MNDQDKKLEDGLAFFGAITASVSHELNNVISIIDQTVGLLEDLLASPESRTSISPERLEFVAQSIKKQTDRGLEIIRRLNRFAHSADRPAEEFDLGETASNLTGLTQRLAGLKRVNLELTPIDKEIKITGSRFFFIMALFKSLQYFLDSAENGGNVSITIEEIDNKVHTKIESDFPVDEDTIDFEFLNKLLSSLSGQIDSVHKPDKCTFTITIEKTS